jgi:hypothetical protein
LDHAFSNYDERKTNKCIFKVNRTFRKGAIMNRWEAFHIQGLHNLGSLIEEQQPPEHNPLFTLGSFD